MKLWSCSLSRSRDKQKQSYLYCKLYLDCKKASGKQTWQNDNFPWWSSTYNVTWPFGHVALWDMRFTFRKWFSTQTLKSSLTSCLCCFLSKVFNSSQTQYEFCLKDFKSLGRHVWRCQARLLNRETSIDSINTASIGQSIFTCNYRATSINSFDNHYDSRENEEKDHNYHCYCGREFSTLRGLNTHRRSCNRVDILNIKYILTTTINFHVNLIEWIPKIKKGDLPKNIKGRY